MSDVVLIDRLGDITFGLPEDLAPHRKPWAYYEILGVERGASTSEIKKAVRRLKSGRATTVNQYDWRYFSR